MIKSISKMQQVARSRIFVLAGLDHVPFVYGKLDNEPILDRQLESELRELKGFLEGQKYVTVAPKELFVIRETGK